MIKINVTKLRFVGIKNFWFFLIKNICNPKSPAYTISLALIWYKLENVHLYYLFSWKTQIYYKIKGIEIFIKLWHG